MKILLVEDEGIIVLGLRMELESAGLNCAVAATGVSAIKSAREFIPDVVLIDINLGSGMDGIECAGEIRNICSPRIIFMTGYVDNELRERASIMRPVGYLVKPVDISDIQSLLDI